VAVVIKKERTIAVGGSPEKNGTPHINIDRRFPANICRDEREQQLIIASAPLFPLGGE
jgi:hypothetical protein